jgi:phosphoribosylglycinamide formyltransferase-1
MSQTAFSDGTVSGKGSTACLGVLLSGRGSNFLAIAESIHSGRLPGAQISIVISNVADAPGLAAAQSLGLSTALAVSKGRPRAEHDAELIRILLAHNVDLVILAGYMRVLSPEFIAAFPGRILNIHPSLLPLYSGLHPQRQALEARATESGCTVHFVDEQVDHGRIVLQRRVPVLPTDDENTLAARILEQEHIAYTEAISCVLRGEVKAY